jgi:hypothetical protein
LGGYKLIEHTVVAAFCHRAELLIPTSARARSGADDEPITFNGDFRFAAKPHMLYQQLRDTNAA